MHLFFTKCRESHLSVRERSIPGHLLTRYKYVIMRVFILATCLTLSGLLQAHTLKSQDLSKVFLSLQLKNSDLKTAFKKIESLTPYRFTYKSEDIQKYSGLNFSATHESLEQILTDLLKKTDLGYEQVDKALIIKKVPQNAAVEAPLQTEAAKLPPVTVSGKVQDELGNPMAGVTVKQKTNPNNGTVTDEKGTYTINVPDNNTVVVFSHIGYETQELQAKDIPTGSTIILKAAPQSLREVAINKGYYNEKKELSTGDVSIVTAKTIGEQPVSDPIQALIGRVPGLNIQQQSGVPGAYDRILLRGPNSIANGNDPLYVIDGVPFSSVSLTPTRGVGGNGGGALGSPSGGLVSNISGSIISNNTTQGGGGMSPFNLLNPADIESIEILKDADATAIYGSRGANGVILITTKKGQIGDTKFTLNVNQGVGQVGHFIDLLNTQQYLQMRKQAFNNDGLLVPSIATNSNDNNYDINGVWDTTRYTNWQKKLIGGTAQFTNIQGNLSGGNANTQFLLGGGYLRQTTVYPGNYADTKGSVHMALTHTSNNQRFHVQLTANYVKDNSDLPQLDLASQIIMAPDAPALYNTNGSLNWQILNGTNTWNNPLANSYNSVSAVTNSLSSNLNFGYKIFSDLELSVSMGYNDAQLNENSEILAASAFPLISNPPRENILSTSDFSTWIVEPLLTYRHKIGKGQLNVTLGSTFQQNLQKQITNTAIGFASDALVNYPAAASIYQLNTDNYTQYRYNAFYGRIGYDWDDKYLLNLTARRDGSSRFGSGYQFGNFGAIGAGWIFSREKSVRDALPWLSFGKLRASYGTTGNDQMADYQFLSTYTVNSTPYQSSTGLRPTSLTNPYFHWEEVQKLEGGLELGFLKNRINIEASYYRDRTINELVGEPLSLVTGFSIVQYNLPAVVQNSGVELSLNSINIKSSNGLSWATNVTFTLPYNKLVSFQDLASSSYANIFTLGKSLYTEKLFQYAGVNPQTGLYTFLTQNAGGIPSAPQDYVTSEPITQKFYGGLQNTISYKGLSLVFFIQFVKQTAFSYLNYFSYAGQVDQNLPTATLSAWQKPGDITNIQRFTTGNTNAPSTAYGNLFYSTAMITDASFIRLKNISLSYALPKTWQEWAHISNGRIFLQGQNLLTITNYIGLDPETQGLSLPPLRVITMGLSATF